LKPTILIFDDDAESVRFLNALLQGEFEVKAHPCSHPSPFELISTHKPSLILVDSFILCKKLKKDPISAEIPLMVLSSLNTSSDVAEGLSLGAEDFLTKPFDHKELLLRIRKHLKTSLTLQQQKVIRKGALEIDTTDRTAKYEGKTLNLTITEYDIIRLLASRAGETISREEIMKTIWKESASDTTDRTIDVHIRSLRKKVPELENHIKSVYGVGYQYLE
jgi:DNA-binding response OmpR family regulator